MSDVYTIKARLEEVHRALVHLNTGVRALIGLGDDGPDGSDDERAHYRHHIDKDVLVDALLAASHEASEHMYWLSLLPESVLGAPAPDDDEAANATRRTTTPEDTEANRRRMVEAAILRAAAPSSLLDGDTTTRRRGPAWNIEKPVADLASDDREGA